MVVDDLDIQSTVISPMKADSPLVIDSDAVLSTAISSELL
jgi:hypothetical protein